MLGAADGDRPGAACPSRRRSASARPSARCARAPPRKANARVERDARERRARARATSSSARRRARSSRRRRGRRPRPPPRSASAPRARPGRSRSPWRSCSVAPGARAGAPNSLEHAPDERRLARRVEVDGAPRRPRRAPPARPSARTARPSRPARRRGSTSVEHRRLGRRTSATCHSSPPSRSASARSRASERPGEHRTRRPAATQPLGDEAPRVARGAEDDDPCSHPAHPTPLSSKRSLPKRIRVKDGPATDRAAGRERNTWQKCTRSPSRSAGRRSSSRRAAGQAGLRFRPRRRRRHARALHRHGGQPARHRLHAAHGGHRGADVRGRQDPRLVLQARGSRRREGDADRPHDRPAAAAAVPQGLALRDAARVDPAVDRPRRARTTSSR